MKYAIRLHGVFNNLEELKEIFQDVIDNAENFGLDNYPNCGCNTHDFDLLPMNNKNVWEFINKLEVSMFLRDTDFYGSNLSYQDVLDNLDEYVDPLDMHYINIKNLLTKLTNK